VKLILPFVEVLEEHRDLFLEEWNFKDILDRNLIHLLHPQKIYWKLQSKVKWIKPGDLGTNFFAAATIKVNVITSI
jgi:hypothetical protein